MHRGDLDVSTTLDTLRRARDWISSPKRWCQDVPACDRYGNHLDPTNYDAVRWCAAGSIERVLHGQPGYRDAVHALAKLGLDCDAPSLFLLLGKVSLWNDAPERTHADVIAAFDQAIERLEKEQAK